MTRNRLRGAIFLGTQTVRNLLRDYKDISQHIIEFFISEFILLEFV